MIVGNIVATGAMGKYTNCRLWCIHALRRSHSPTTRKGVVGCGSVNTAAGKMSSGGRIHHFSARLQVVSGAKDLRSNGAVQSRWA
jgi:hypothetical protein